MRAWHNTRACAWRRCTHTIVNRSACGAKTKACPFEWYCADAGAPNGGACGDSVVCGADDTSSEAAAGDGPGAGEHETTRA